MADVLEDERNIRQAHLSPQQIIVIILELLVCEMIPSSDFSVCGIGTFTRICVRASITVQQCLSLHYLPAIFATLALECLMRFAERVLVEEE